MTDKPKRRWYQFSLRTLIVVITIAALILGWPFVRRQYNCWRLQGYDGKELLTLSEGEQKQLDRAVAAVVGPTVPPAAANSRYFQTWLIGRFSGNERADRTVIVQVAPGLGLERPTFVRVFFVDQFGQVIHSDIQETKVGRLELDVTAHAFPCISVEEVGFSVWRYRYWYSLADDKLELLRIESFEGKLALPGNGRVYYSENRGWPESRNLLLSGQKVDQLRALACLAALAMKFELPGILESTDKLRLKELAKSSDPWVKEEAQAFLDILARSTSLD